MRQCRLKTSRSLPRLAGARIAILKTGSERSAIEVVADLVTAGDGEHLGHYEGRGWVWLPRDLSTLCIRHAYALHHRGNAETFLALSAPQERRQATQESCKPSNEGCDFHAADRRTRPSGRKRHSRSVMVSGTLPGKREGYCRGNMARRDSNGYVLAAAAPQDRQLIGEAMTQELAGLSKTTLLMASW